MGPRRYYIVILIIFLASPSFADWTEPKNLEKLNTDSNEFAFTFDKSRNNIIFNSDRTGTSKFYVMRDSSLSLLKGKINSESKNSSYFSYINSKNAIISSFREGETQSYLNLFYSNFIKNEWSEGILIEELSGNFFCSQATVSSDGNLLVFISNQNNDPNDTDLFMSYKRPDGKWDTPINIEYLNTSGREITPHFSGNDSLFFASDGRGGEGGLELFLSVLELGTWQRPIPLVGINTSYDESDPAFDQANNRLIFASNKPGGRGNLDLYESFYIESDINKQSNDVKIDLESYVSSINVSLKENTNSNLIFPYAIFNKNSTEISPEFKQEFDSIIQNIMSITNVTNITLVAWLNSKIENELENNSKVLADKRLKLLTNKLLQLGLDSSQISFKYETDKNISKYPDNILFLINGDLPQKYLSREISIQPQVFEFFVYPSPENKVNEISAKISLNDKFCGLEKSSQNIPAKFSFDLRKVTNSIVESDSLVISVTVNSDKEISTSKNFEYVISKSTNIIGGDDEFDLYILSNSHLESLYFKNSLQKLLNDFYNGGKLEMTYNQEIDANTLESISNLFGNNISISKTPELKDDYLIKIKKVK